MAQSGSVLLRDHGPYPQDLNADQIRYLAARSEVQHFSEREMISVNVHPPDNPIPDCPCATYHKPDG